MPDKPEGKGWYLHKGKYIQLASGCRTPEGEFYDPEEYGF